jgi:ribosomal protein S6
MQYELFYLVGASREADLEKIRNAAEEIVKSAGGEFSEKTTIEKRRLSYAVKHENHGIYIARRFELQEPEKLKEITKNLNLNGDVLRFILSRADELPELKTKEERMNSLAKEARNKEKREEKEPATKKEEEIKVAPVKKKEEAKEEIKEEAKEKKEEPKKEKAKDDDLDKKLEEILNI